MSIAIIKQNDTARYIADTLTLDGTAIDLTDCSVVLVIRLPDGTVKRRNAEIVALATGQVRYHFVEEDVAQYGTMQLEWEITFDSEDVLTVPGASYMQIKVVPELG